MDPAFEHPHPLGGETAHPTAVVLDTNVVLDWLLFRDAGCSALAAQLEAGQLRWCSTASMRKELAGVLLKPQLRDRAPGCEHILSVFDRLSQICPEPPRATQAHGRLRCRDPDDQVFIDLAVAWGSRWLFSKDRALLALARHARACGVEVLTPARWQLQRQGAHRRP